MFVAFLTDTCLFLRLLAPRPAPGLAQQVIGLWSLLYSVCSIHFLHWVIVIVLKVGLDHITDEQKGGVVPKTTLLDVVLLYLRTCKSPKYNGVTFSSISSVCFQLCLGDLQHLICCKCFCVAVRPYCIGNKDEEKSMSIPDRPSLFCTVLVHDSGTWG